MVLTVAFLLVGVFICVMQTTALQMIPGTFTRPDLVFILVAFAAYKLPWLPGILLAFSMGWILDVLVGVNLGMYPLQLLLILVCLKLVSMNSPVKESAFQIPLVGLAYFLMQILVYLTSSVANQHGVSSWSWGGMVQETILLVLAAIPVFLLFNLLYEYIQDRVNRSRTARRRVRKKL